MPILQKFLTILASTTYELGPNKGELTYSDTATTIEQPATVTAVTGVTGGFGAANAELAGASVKVAAVMATAAPCIRLALNRTSYFLLMIEGYYFS